VLCTTSRARKVVVALTLVALIAIAIHQACWHLFATRVAQTIDMVTFNAVVPVAVLIINMIVVREVRRRASSNAASNLGIQHHQSTSSNSAVPTVMLVSTSLIYVLLNGVWCFAKVAIWQLHFWSLVDFYHITECLYESVYAYNFYVYLVTGKQFRSELHKLFCACCRRCRSCSSCSSSCSSCSCSSSSSFSSSSSSSSSPAAAAAAAAAAVNVRVARRGQAHTSETSLTTDVHQTFVNKQAYNSTE